MKICYSCGKEFDNKEMNKEHIPAKALFVGYPDDYKVNRITVPSCIKCNSDYSVDDEEFRNLIGIINSDISRDILSEKSAKSMIKIKNQVDRLVINQLGTIEGVEFEESAINNFHTKNFKGVFYKEYGYAIPETYKIVPFTEPTEQTKLLLHYLTDNFEWKVSGNRNVFGYIIQPSREVKNKKVDLKPASNDKIIACLDYNLSHTALVVAINTNQTRITKDLQEGF